MPVNLSAEKVMILAFLALSSLYAAWLHRRASPGEILKKSVVVHVLFFSLSFASLVALIDSRLTSSLPLLPQGLVSKTAYYIDHADDFNLLFVGDSRTYCGLQPDIMDGLLGTRSVNLSCFAHWFPTQYPQVQDVLPSVPPGTTVLWSIGSQNFQPVTGGDIWRAYPVGRHNVTRYQEWGFRYEEMRHNIETVLPLDTFVPPRFATTATIADVVSRLNDLFWRAMEDPLHARVVSAAEGVMREAEKLAESYRRNPEVANVTVLTGAGGKVHSLALRKARGSYSRVELDRAFFRQQQANRVRDRRGRDWGSTREFRADPAYWNLFAGILELFRRHRIRLVVSEIEEAPHVYDGPNHRLAVRRFMREQVRPLVESHGFAYVNIDYDLLFDEHYFDYNHLNSRGVEKFSPLLGKVLEPHL